MRQPWEWRKASGGFWLDPIFHAYDINDYAACSPSTGLLESCEDPNEGSPLCVECVAIVQTEPAGRNLIVHR